MEEKLHELISLIESSDLDDTIKQILVRDLKEEGLTDFLREQIKAYCAEQLKKNEIKYQVAKEILEEKGMLPEEKEENPV